MPDELDDLTTNSGSDDLLDGGDDHVDEKDLDDIDPLLSPSVIDDDEIDGDVAIVDSTEVDEDAVVAGEDPFGFGEFDEVDENGDAIIKDEDDEESEDDVENLDLF